MNSIITRDYQICKNCVMDTTDSKITFDEKGVSKILYALFSPQTELQQRWDSGFVQYTISM